MKDPRTDVEQAVRSACDAQDFQTAATQALENFGPEIFGFLVARLRARSDAEETFAIFAEDVWKGLPGFGFRCSVRGWMYALARNAANRYAKSPQRRRERNLPLGDEATFSALVDRVRSATRAYARTDVKDKMRQLRERLPNEDQTLLILHIDRGLPWRELAVVMNDTDQDLDDTALQREAARLRKRFERLKADLRELAIAEGIFKP